MSTLYCPLCMQRLEDGSVLEMYCLEHFGEPREIRCTSEFVGTLQCSNSCHAHRRIDLKPLVFLHRDCPVIFPYDRIADLAVLQARIRGETTDISHWEIGVLMQLAARLREPGPMFFPLAALLATSEQRRRTGSVLVGLSGEVSVGKTVLALQSMTRRGYGKRKLLADVHNFLYAQPGHEALEDSEFFNLLHLVSNRNATLAWRNPDATRAEGVNVKAIFFSPSPARKPALRGDPEGEPEVPPQEDLVHQLMRGAVKESRAWFGSVRDYMKRRSPADTPTLFLYDSPGEHAGDPRDPLFNLDLHADVIAVAVDARDIWKPKPGEPHQTIRRACVRLQRSRQALGALHQKPRVALIVTKVDMVPELLQKASPHLDSFMQADADALRDLAAEGLRGAAEEDEHFEGILSRLEQNEIDRVFMIATSHLDPAHANGRPPETVGLSPFVVWALRIPWQELFAEP